VPHYFVVVTKLSPPHILQPLKTQLPPVGEELRLQRLLLCDNQNRRSNEARLRSMGLASLVGLSAQVRGDGAGVREVAGENGMEERAEDELCASVVI